MSKRSPSVVRNVLAAIACVHLVAPIAASAAVVIALPGPSTGYHVTNQPAFLSTSVAKAYDTDGDNVYGTLGYLMFGADDGQTGQTGQPFTDHVNKLPTWATASAGANFDGVAYGFPGYAPIDDPTLAPAPTVADWSPERSGVAVSNDGGAGSWNALVNITLTAGAPGSFRLGVLAGNEGNTFSDGRNQSPGIRLTGPDGSIATITGLPFGAPSANWVFFDVDLNGAPGGVFTLWGQKRLASVGNATIGGFTFDAIPTPAALPAGLMMLAALAARRRPRRSPSLAQRSA